MTTVQVEEKGEVVEKKVNRYELNKMRMAQARDWTPPNMRTTAPRR